MSLLGAVVETQQRSFELGRAPRGWLFLCGVLVVGLLCYATVWLYRREQRAGAGRGLRAGLAALRCAVLLGLAGVWLEPMLATYLLRSSAGQVAVLVDASASMAVSDADAEGAAATGATRFERVQSAVLADDAAWLRAVQERNEVNLYVFGAEPASLALPWATVAAGSMQPATLRDIVPNRPQTDLGTALAGALDDLGDSPVAGVILLTDGAANHGPSTVELAAAARRLKTPLYTVGVGGTEEPANLRVVNLAAPAAVPPEDPFEVRIELAAAGVAVGEIEVQLTVEPVAAGAEQPITTRRVRLDPAGSAAPLLIPVTPPGPGEYLYRARVAPLEQEAIRDDNTREATVLVLDQRLRVLIVAGGPHFEYRAVTALLTRDDTLDVSCWLQSADARAIRDGHTVITELPRSPEELFAYDVILLLDPDPAELDESWAVLARRWVDEFSGGLLYQAGAHFATRFLRDDRLHELVAILPVSPDPDADMRLQAQGTYRARPTAFQLPASAAAHPLLTLQEDAERSAALWSALPGVWWYLPVLRAKPVATVLLEHAGAASRNQYGPAVLMATQPVGGGRAVFLGFDSTWRWRATAEPQFNRLWVQTVRYLAQARRQQTSRRGTLTFDREAFGFGDYVKIEARLLDAAFHPSDAPQVEGTVQPEGQPARPLVLSAALDRPGWFTGRLLLDFEGPAVVDVPLPGADGGRLVKRIRVERPDLEMRTLRQRDDVLRELAAQTGGRYVPLAEIQQLPPLIEKAAQRRPPQRIAAQPLWDQGWVLLVLAALLGLEWTLRRRNHLL